MDKNHENLWKDFEGKAKDGYGTILIKFGEACFPVLAKPIDPTDTILKDIEESKRLNLTAWKYKTHPLVEDIKKCNVSGTDVLYWNGFERVWKFYDNGILINDRLISFSNSKIEKIADEIIDFLKGNQFDWWKIYEPHCDETGNYGDEETHAVYDNIGKSCNLKQSKLENVHKIIHEAKAKLEDVYYDLYSKKCNHKKMKIDADLLNDLKDLLFELEYT